MGEKMSAVAKIMYVSDPILRHSLPLQEANLAASIVIVGTGPVGIRIAEEILKRDPHASIVLYGDEPWEPYNRVKLSSLLSGDERLEGIQNPLQIAPQAQVIQHHNCCVTQIDRETKTVTDVTGRVQPYSHLVLATGSKPHIPSIPGTDLAGVYTFRDLNDIQQLMARRVRSRQAVVLGGGLLGLEAAHGLQRSGTQVTVIEHASRLMYKQLDDEGAQRLRERLMSLGVLSILQTNVESILGDTQVTGVMLRGGRSIECDTVVLATGIRPNIVLARQAGLAVGRGIRVDDQLYTSDPNISAVGECAEHRGEVYGLVAPGFEQAAVAAYNITSGQAQYTGSMLATKLKVVGLPVTSIGRTGEDEPTTQLDTYVYHDAAGGCYRKILMERNRIVGAVGVGDWPGLQRIQAAISRKARLWPWQLHKFRSQGYCWTEAQAPQVGRWPASATVCNCTGVTRGDLSKAIARGATSVAELAQCTNASTVCGGCKPLLSDLLGADKVAPVSAYQILLGAGVVSLLAMLSVLLMPMIPYGDSVQARFQWDVLWRASIVKQSTGFILLGLGVVMVFISLRKRTKRVTLGTFSGWRVVHILVGCLVAVSLIAHTGLRLGHNLNFYLMLSFIGLMLLGSVASIAIGLSHVLPRAVAQTTRSLSIWSHILLLWPVPSLLGFHVLKTYWY